MKFWEKYANDAVLFYFALVNLPLSKFSRESSFIALVWLLQ